MNEVLPVQVYDYQNVHSSYRYKFNRKKQVLDRTNNLGDLRSLHEKASQKQSLSFINRKMAGILNGCVTAIILCTKQDTNNKLVFSVCKAGMFCVLKRIQKP